MLVGDHDHFIGSFLSHKQGCLHFRDLPVVLETSISWPFIARDFLKNVHCERAILWSSIHFDQFIRKEMCGEIKYFAWVFCDCVWI